MKKFLMAALAASTMAFAGGDIVEEQIVVVEPALTGFYVGAGYTNLTNDISAYDLTLTDSANAGVILAGYNINEYVAVEGRYTFVSTTDFVVLDDAIDADTWGIYVKPQYSLTDEFKVYALLGYGEVKYIDDDAGFQYGVGAAYSVTKNVEVFGDWVRAYDDSLFSDEKVTVNGTVDAFTFGVNYKF